MIIKPKLAGQTPDNMDYWVDVQKYDAVGFMSYTNEVAQELQAQVHVQDLSSVIKPFAIQSRFGFAEGGLKGNFYKPF